jgi:hypothetical protein
MVSRRRLKPSLSGTFQGRRLLGDVGRFVKRGHRDGIDADDVAEHVYQEFLRLLRQFIAAVQGTTVPKSSSKCMVRAPFVRPPFVHSVGGVKAEAAAYLEMQAQIIIEVAKLDKQRSNPMDPKEE